MTESTGLPEETTSRLGPIQASIDDAALRCFGRLGAWDQAEEATGETYLNVLRAIAGKTELTDKELKDWILQLCDAVTLDVLRRRGARSDQGVFDSSRVERRSEGKVPYPHTERRGGGSVEAGLTEGSLVERLREPHKSILKMRAWCGLEWADVAETLGLNQDAVRQGFAGALKSLGDEQLAERCRNEAELEKLLSMSPENLCTDVKQLTLPEQMLEPRKRSAILERALSIARQPVGDLEFVNGPLDIFPADVSVGGKIRMGGHTRVRHGKGDRVYAGELLLTGPKTTVALRLTTGRLTIVAPASALMFGMHGSNGSGDLLTMLGGKLLSLEADERKSGQSILCLGRRHHIEHGDFGVVMRGQSVSAVEVLGGRAARFDKNGNKSASQKPYEGWIAIEYQVARHTESDREIKVPDSAKWLAPLVEKSELPKDVCQQIRRVAKKEGRSTADTAVEDGTPRPNVIPPDEKPSPREKQNRELREFLDTQAEEDEVVARKRGKKKKPVAAIVVGLVVVAAAAVAAAVLLR